MRCWTRGCLSQGEGEGEGERGGGGGGAEGERGPGLRLRLRLRLASWAAIGQVAMSALGSGRACVPRLSPPTVYCLSQCPPIVRTANVLCARSLPYTWSSRPLRSELGLWTRGLYWVRRAYRSVVSPTLCALIAGPVRPAPRWMGVGP